MANLPSHLRSLLSVNEIINPPPNPPPTPSISMITQALPPNVPPHHVIDPSTFSRALAQTSSTDINALRTKAALDNVKIVLQDVGKVLQGVRRGEKEMMDKVGELKVGMDKSIEGSGRECKSLDSGRLALN